MDFDKLCELRQSCRSYDSERTVEKEKIDLILSSARLAPSACNGQPYHITVCRGAIKDRVAKATQGPGINGFVSQAPVLFVISEKPYVKTAAIGSKFKKNDYRSIDIGILTAVIVSRACELGLSTCILGWFSDDQIRSICGLDESVRLVIALGYAEEGEVLRGKKRKSTEELVTFLGDDQ